MTVSATDFYSEYFGHDTEHLRALHDQLRRGGRSAVFLAGDSSLDNKCWLGATSPALNGYQCVLSPPVQKQDVCYWLNHEAVRRGRQDLFCLNTAIEATSLNDRACGRLLRQDLFIRDHITGDDYLIVSVGGNDLALALLLATILNIVPLLCLTPKACIQRGQACPPNTGIDCGCCGCGLPGCLVAPFGFPPGLAYVSRSGDRTPDGLREINASRIWTRIGTVRRLVQESRRELRAETAWAQAAQEGRRVHDLLPRRARARLVG